MINSVLALVPPLLVIMLAWLTRNVLFSLSVGIVGAALVVHNFVFQDALSFALSRLWTVSELGKLASWQTFWTSTNLFLCLFLVLLGILITLMQASGAAYAYAHFVASRVKTPAGAERSSLLLSTLFFIDDYFSCLTVGSVMQAITDRFKVPRVKLAVLVNLIAAPLVVLVPLSSWVAEIVGQLRNSGVGMEGTRGVVMYGDPFYAYIAAIPYMFYASIMVFTLWYVVCKKLSFGVIAAHEAVAQKTGNLFGGKMPVVRRHEEVSEAVKASSSLFDFIFPLGLLLCLVPTLILYWGKWWFFGGDKTFIDAIGTANAFSSSALFSAVALTLVATCLFLVVRKKLAAHALPKLFAEGFFVMGSTPIMLILIWTLSGMLGSDVGTGNYLASLLMGHMSTALLPLFFFGLAVVISVMISSSWATMGMLIPVAVRLVPSFIGLELPVDLIDVPLLFPVLGAIISGSIVGNHASPIADVILMASSSAGAYHLDVVKGHICFSLPTVFSAAMAFLFVGYGLERFGFWPSTLGALAIGIIINLVLFHLLACLARRAR